MDQETTPVAEHEAPRDWSLKTRRDLRRSSTAAEELIWSVLRRHRIGGYKFRRQHPVGPYFVDFCCVKRKLVVEIDGDYHDHVVEQDLQRQRYLESTGYTVLRFSNEDVNMELEAVIRGIAAWLGVEA